MPRSRLIQGNHEVAILRGRIQELTTELEEAVRVVSAILPVVTIVSPEDKALTDEWRAKHGRLQTAPEV